MPAQIEIKEPTEIREIRALFDAGTHYGYARTRRHPTAVPFIFTTKDRIDIFNLEETEKRLEAAVAFAKATAANGKQLLFVGGKHEASLIVRTAAESAGQPFVAGRWIGGTLTNFKNIRKRIDRLEKLTAEREAGELEKYTKKERLLIDREIIELTLRFGGLVKMADLPAALFVVDSRHENTAVREANQLSIPVIGLSSSDGDFSVIQYPIPGNDTSVRSIRFVTDAVSVAYRQGAQEASERKAAPVAEKNPHAARPARKNPRV